MFAVAASNVNGGLVDFFHGVQVAIMFALMTNIVQFAWWKVKGKKHLSHCARMRPVYLLLFATVLVCTQPVCMLIIGSWTDMKNFFFDGGDMGALCGPGQPKPGDASHNCGSGTCSADSAEFAVNYIWKTTGCQMNSDGTAKIPDFLDSYYQTRTAAELATDINNLCTGKADGLEKSVCGAASVEVCKLVSIASDNVPDLTVCTSDDFYKEAACKGTCEMDSNALWPNTGIGVAIQILCTYGGFIVMFTGVFEATGLHKKILKKWRNLRR